MSNNWGEISCERWQSVVSGKTKNGYHQLSIGHQSGWVWILLGMLSAVPIVPVQQRLLSDYLKYSKRLWKSRQVQSTPKPKVGEVTSAHPWTHLGIASGYCQRIFREIPSYLPIFLRSLGIFVGQSYEGLSAIAAQQLLSPVIAVWVSFTALTEHSHQLTTEAKHGMTHLGTKKSRDHGTHSLTDPNWNSGHQVKCPANHDPNQWSTSAPTSVGRTWANPKMIPPLKFIQLVVTGFGAHILADKIDKASVHDMSICRFQKNMTTAAWTCWKWMEMAIFGNVRPIIQFCGPRGQKR